jgi:hypothetical protein
LKDLIAWDSGIRDGRVLKSESWTQAFTPVALNTGKTYPYGYGWNVGAVAGRRAQWHGGSWQGFKSYIARYPDDGLSVIVLANLAQADPERISNGIAALIEPALTRTELKPIADTDPAMQARVRRLLAQAAAGDLSAKEFSYVRAGFFPLASKAYADALAGAGPLTGLSLFERRELGDDQVYTYDVAFAAQHFRLSLSVAPDGKLAAFDLRRK